MPNASRIGHCLPVTWVIDVYQKAQLHQFIAHELHQMVQQNLLVDICSCWDRLQKRWSRNLGTLSPQDYIQSKLTKMAMVFHPSLCVCPLQGDFAALPTKRWSFFPAPRIWASGMQQKRQCFDSQPWPREACKLGSCHCHQRSPGQPAGC